MDTDSGETMAAFEHGEIWIHCITTMKGYHGRPEDTAAVLTADGWLRTGMLKPGSEFRRGFFCGKHSSGEGLSGNL